MAKDKSQICRNCFWWKHEDGLKVCGNSAPTFSCHRWVDKEKEMRCANCKKYRTDKCPYSDTGPSEVCMSWEAMPTQVATIDTETLPEAPTADEVKGMIESGKDPFEISKLLGFEIDGEFDGPLTVHDPAIKILKHHLNTLFKILPAAEIHARLKPNSYNVASLISIMDASRDLLSDIEERKDPKETYNELASGIIEPLTTKFLELITESFNEIKIEMVKNVPSDKKSLIDTQIKYTLKDLGSKMQEALLVHLNELRRVVGANDDN